MDPVTIVFRLDDGVFKLCHVLLARDIVHGKLSRPWQMSTTIFHCARPAPLTVTEGRVEILLHYRARKLTYPTCNPWN